jgi:hypothetical protein
VYITCNSRHCARPWTTCTGHQRSRRSGCGYYVRAVGALLLHRQRLLYESLHHHRTNEGKYTRLRKRRNSQLTSLDSRTHGASIAQLHRVYPSGRPTDRLRTLMLCHDLLLFARTEVLETADGGQMLGPQNAGCCRKVGLRYVGGMPMSLPGAEASVYNAMMDVFCAIMPYFIIRSLNIPRKDKRNLIILMGGSIL